MVIPSDVELVLMSVDPTGVFRFNYVFDVRELPCGAEYDNWLAVEEVFYDVYALPGLPLVGRTAALRTWIAEVVEGGLG